VLGCEIAKDAAHDSGYDVARDSSNCRNRHVRNLSVNCF
jgi:hypothetical protein